MNEGNLNNENNSVQPEVNVQPTEPVVSVTTEPVQQPVQPVAPAQPVQQPPLQSVVAEQPKKKSMLPVVLIILLLLVIAGCLVYYFFLKDKISLPGSNNNTTTQSSKLLDIKSIDDYKKIVQDKEYDPEEDNYNGVLLLDDSFYVLNFDIYNKCKNDGDKVSFNIKNSKIEYTCKYDEDVCEFGECEDQDEWRADITVNDKHKIGYSTYTTCGHSTYFTNGKYYLEAGMGCTIGMSDMKLSSESNDTITKGNYEMYYFKSTNEAHDDEGTPTPILIKDNIVYYIKADNSEEDGETTCRVKYVDFNKDKVEVKDMNIAEKCYHTTGE